MRYLTRDDVIAMHAELIAQTGGNPGIRDLGLIDSAIAQPSMTYAGTELYSTLVEKAAALAFGSVKNHGFIDGNKRIGQAAMEVFLVINGHEIRETVDESERLIMSLASGSISRDELIAWLSTRVVPHPMSAGNDIDPRA